jgi:hypothetical protein
VQQQEEDLDADAEGDEDFEGDDGEEDLTLYCFCQKQSFGDVWIFLSHVSLLVKFLFSPTDDRMRQQRLSIPMGEWTCRIPVRLEESDYNSVLSSISDV